MSTPFANRAAEMTASNPANAPETAPKRRIPMGLPTLKLEVPAIPGYVCHWMRGTPQRIQQATNAGYEFVDQSEVQVNGLGLANDYLGNNHTDLGTRVSISAGGDAEAGRLILMKIKKELWDEDQLAVNQKHADIAARLRGDNGLAEAGMDTSNRYTRGEQRTHMFNPKPRSA